MHTKTLISSIAVSLSLALAAPAFADTVVGGVTVSDADMPTLMTYCVSLAGNTDASAAAAAAPVSLGDANSNDKDNKNQTLENKVGNAATVNEGQFAAITLDQCKEAGIGK